MLEFTSQIPPYYCFTCFSDYSGRLPQVMGEYALKERLREDESSNPSIDKAKQN
jgi:hypothetical protein